MHYQKLISERLYLSPMNINNYEFYTKYLNDLEVGIGSGCAEKDMTKFLWIL